MCTLRPGERCFSVVAGGLRIAERAGKSSVHTQDGGSLLGGALLTADSEFCAPKGRSFVSHCGFHASVPGPSGARDATRIADTLAYQVGLKEKQINTHISMCGGDID